MKKLPSHTTRYFAAECYRAFMYRGKTDQIKNKTVYGIDLTCQYSAETNAVICTYAYNGKEIVHAEKVRKAWIY